MFCLSFLIHRVFHTAFVAFCKQVNSYKKQSNNIIGGWLNKTDLSCTIIQEVGEHGKVFPKSMTRLVIVIQITKQLKEKLSGIIKSTTNHLSVVLRPMYQKLLSSVDSRLNV